MYLFAFIIALIVGAFIKIKKFIIRRPMLRLIYGIGLALLGIGSFIRALGMQADEHHFMWGLTDTMTTTRILGALSFIVGIIFIISYLLRKNKIK